MRAAVLSIAAAASLALAAPAHAAPTWLAPVTAVPFSTGDVRDTEVAGNDAGHSIAVWTKLDASAPGCCSRVAFVQHSPGGGFSSAKPLSPAGINAENTDVGIDGGGTATIVWGDIDGANNNVKAVAVDAAGNVGEIQTLSTAGLGPRVAVAAGGRAIATWIEGDRIRAAVREPGAATFGASDPISASGAVEQGDVAADAVGDAVAVWIRAGAVEASRRPAGGTFQAVADAVPGASGATNVVLAMTPSGRATAIWDHFAVGASEVRTAERTIAPDFAGGSWSAAERASPSGVDAGSPSVALDAQNTAVAVWKAGSVVQSGTRASGASFTGYQPLSNAHASGFASEVDIAPDGTAVAIWLGTSGARPAIQSARRPPGGTFGGVSDLELGDSSSNPTVSLFSPRLAVDDQGNATALWSRFRFSDPTSLDINEWSVAVAGHDAAAPALSAVSIPASGTVGAAIGMAAAASDRWSPFTLSWAFGDGVGDAGAAVSHAYGAAGAFGATVTATDAVGNAASAGGQVLISPLPVIVTPRIDSTVQSKWGFDRRTGRRFFLFRLKVVAPPKGSAAQLRCRGRRCPFQSRRFTRIRRNAITLYKTVSAAKVAKKRNRRFRAGQTVQLRITAPGFIGKVVTYKLERRKQPVGRVRCLPPGATKPVKC